MPSLGSLFIISAPSGGGKTSLVNALIDKVSDLKISISHTTRLPRAGEVEGKNYFFIDEKLFTIHRDQGLFLEHANVFNHWYGTSKKWVMDELQQGTDVILEIDWQGARRVKEQMDCVTIFIIPPSTEILYERLNKRMQDPPEVIEARMAQARNEISHYAEYDYLVVNQDFDLALKDLETIVKANRLSILHQKTRYAPLLKDLID